MAEQVITTIDQLRTTINKLELGLNNEQEDKLVNEMFRLFCSTGTEAFQNGYTKGKRAKTNLKFKEKKPKEPYMCELCGLHVVEDEGGWCEECIEDREKAYEN
ncbi:hypothetical protein MZM54_04340 [[Brevibacterium] frigoritolerans]|nr:hypothetical protein [Peribacillus frigoritolerans]